MGCRRTWFLQLLAVFLLWSSTSAVCRKNMARAQAKKALRVAAGKPSFKIAIFADLHFGENAWTDWGPLQDVLSTGLMSSVLEEQKPDFAVYLGDVITANNMAIANASAYWDQAIAPARDKRIPFATVFGNHDDARFEWPMEWFSPPGVPKVSCPAAAGAGDCSFRGTGRVELMRKEVERNRELSFSASGPNSLWPSVSNYVVPVGSSNGSGSPVLLMYFLDSGGGSYPGVISGAQSDWLQAKFRELNPDGRIPEIMFWHIPSTAYASVAPKSTAGVAQPCVGSINAESVASQDKEIATMDILVKRPSVKAVFVGHNHGMDWCCPYQKLWLCYARHTGYGGYGSWDRGVRLVELIGKPFSLKSWITMANGESHSEIILAS
ncbi:unnamed protein product [Linum trigynum]|uniref:Calcineurin-like phosphoesterase domain-containing protein n=1 Tax=Linum trigynum TaxID=586398 RepID=A0AAV2C7Q8_9ROSI